MPTQHRHTIIVHNAQMVVEDQRSGAALRASRV
jgi:hypothetical protein